MKKLTLFLAALLIALFAALPVSADASAAGATAFVPIEISVDAPGALMALTAVNTVCAILLLALAVIAVVYWLRLKIIIGSLTTTLCSASPPEVKARKKPVPKASATKPKPKDVAAPAVPERKASRKKATAAPPVS